MTSDRIKETAERIAVLSDRFVHHDRYQPMEDQFRLLLETRLADIAAGRANEATGMTLSAASGAGKSTAMSFLLSRAREWIAASEQPDAVIISLRVPSPATLKFVGQTLLRALGFQISSERQAWYIWDLVPHHLKERKVLFVHLDEAQDLSSRGTRHERDAVASMLKTLMTDEDWPVGIILSGTNELENILNHDIQLARRMKTIYFAPLSAIGHANDVLDLVEGYCDQAGLSLQDEAEGLELAERLIHSACNQFGSVIVLTLAAIAEAYLLGDPKLGRQHFAIAFHNRTSCDDAYNTFVVPDYYRINPSQFFGREPDL